MGYISQKILLQFEDAAFSVANKKDKLIISTVFNIELKSTADTPLKWFNIKLKFKNLTIDPKMKIKYQIQNPVDWEKDKCCICNFPLHINQKGFKRIDRRYKTS